MNTSRSLSLSLVGALAALALLLSMFGLLFTATAPEARAASLAEQIICFVDQQLGPDIPFDPQIDYCNDGEPEPTMQCEDGLDNDADGLIDLNDPGCANGSDNSESPDPALAQCADGLDNDLDGLIDLNDPGCSNASDNNETNQAQATTTATVSIHKYVGASPASVGNAGSASFGFAASWAQGGATSTGTFNLASGNGFAAVTSALNLGSNYYVNEVTTSQASTSQILSAGAVCQPGMWRLMGYRTGTSVGNAQSATLSTNSPTLNNLAQNQHVIVVNELCSSATTTDAALHVDSIDAVKTTAIANDNYADGWRYIFHITTPNGEENLSMKFSDWFVSSSSSSTIPVANNMRISTSQASSTGPITITGSGIYTSPAFILDTDLNPSMPGRQVDVVVEVKIPVGTPNDTYTTIYGVQTLP